MKKEFPLKAMPGVVLIEYKHRNEEKTDSGFLIAAPKHRGLPNQGRVLAVGYKVEDIKVGDMVHYSVQSPEGFKYGEWSIIPVNAEDVDAIIHE